MKESATLRLQIQIIEENGTNNNTAVTPVDAMLYCVKLHTVLYCIILLNPEP